MSASPIHFRQNIRHEINYTVLLGLLSCILGLVQFKIPGFENSYSDLREIPLLTSLFYLQNPVSIFAISLITLIATPAGVPYTGNFIMHFFPLLIVWFIYKWLDKQNFHNHKLGIVWGVTTIMYYMLLLFPALIISYQLLGINSELSFIESYSSVAYTSLFEIITTTLITSLFLIQNDFRKTLEHNNRNLEKIILERTKELSNRNAELQVLNEKLIATNEEVNALNENLEQLVYERTEKINHQLTQLSRYAYMNSHQVRAPLARILGIMKLLKIEKEEAFKLELLDKLHFASEELDLVIREMNRLLEREVPSNDRPVPLD